MIPPDRLKRKLDRKVDNASPEKGCEVLNGELA